MNYIQLLESHTHTTNIQPNKYHRYLLSLFPKNKNKKWLNPKSEFPQNTNGQWGSEWVRIKNLNEKAKTNQKIILMKKEGENGKKKPNKKLN